MYEALIAFLIVMVAFAFWAISLLAVYSVLDSRYKDSRNRDTKTMIALWQAGQQLSGFTAAIVSSTSGDPPSNGHSHNVDDDDSNS